MQSLCLRAFRCFGRGFVPGMRYLNNLCIMSYGGFIPDLSHSLSSVRAVGLTAHAVHCLTTWQRERHCREHPSQAEIWVLRCRSFYSADDVRTTSGRAELRPMTESWGPSPAPT